MHSGKEMSDVIRGNPDESEIPSVWKGSEASFLDSLIRFKITPKKCSRIQNFSSQFVVICDSMSLPIVNCEQEKL